MRRRAQTVFSLSFLDCMFCGFGAVILLVMVVNANMLERRDRAQRPLELEVQRLEAELQAARRHERESRAALVVVTSEQTRLALAVARGLAQLEQTSGALTQADAETTERRAQVKTLVAELQALEAQHNRLAQRARPGTERGAQLRRLVGEGDRQYLTGLRVGGKRVVILLDASASMLDESLVNIIRIRNLPEARKRATPKWRRALASVDWIFSQIPASSRFQLYAFNEATWAMVEGTEGQWLDVGAAEAVNAALDRMRQVVPAHGTNLQKAFESLRSLRPAPDNVYLLTDGLPTLSAGLALGSTVSPERRLQHLQAALAELPRGVPVNTILFPMEGDPEAAAAFWRLARNTRGSLLSPARDWP